MQSRGGWWGVGAVALGLLSGGCRATQDGTHYSGSYSTASGPSLSVHSSEYVGALAGLAAGTWLVGEAVDPSGPLGIGVEVQAYPAGVIPGLHLQLPVGLDDGQFLTLRLAANITDRDDFGEQDDEEGSGFGGGVGWRSYLEPGRAGWLIGARVDLWSLDIDWTDDPGQPTEVSGTTELLVLQPTVEAGYGWNLGGWRVELMAGLGFEINVDEDGRDVGQGPIGLVGVTLVRNPNGY